MKHRPTQRERMEATLRETWLQRAWRLAKPHVITHRTDYLQAAMVVGIWLEYGAEVFRDCVG